jgi:hypothetical protein
MQNELLCAFLSEIKPSGAVLEAEVLFRRPAVTLPALLPRRRE